MKPKILKLSTVTLLFCFITAGCQKDDIFELEIGDKNAVIQQEVNGIEFKFCLLNEQGEPATVFNEGENFTFQFSIKNNLDTTIIFDNSLFYTSGFCEVQDQEKSFGVPFKIVGIAEIGEVAFSIPYRKTIVWEVLWIPENNEWSKGFVYYKRNNLQYLLNGKYYTKFTQKFDFGIIKTDPLTFKINFEIK